MLPTLLMSAEATNATQPIAGPVMVSHAPGLAVMSTLSTASLAVALAGCASPRPTDREPTSQPMPSVGQARAETSVDQACLDRVKLEPEERLGTQWSSWLKWGANLALPSVTAVDPTTVEIGEIRTHAVLARHGKARFTANGPTFADAGGTTAMFPVVVLDTAPELARVRIVSEFDGTEVFVWVEQTDLLPIPHERSQLLGPSARSGALLPGVWIAPGRILQPVEFDSKSVRMMATFGGLHVEGTMPADRLGYVFAYDHFGPFDEKDTQLIRGNLLSEPGGAPVATSDISNEAEHVDGAVSILDSDSGWDFVEVVSRDGTIVVRGWVDASRVAPATGGVFVAAPFSGSEQTKPKEDPKPGLRRLEPGTRLLAEDGAVLGRIRWPEYDLPECGADLVAVPSHWGPLVFRVDRIGE